MSELKSCPFCHATGQQYVHMRYKKRKYDEGYKVVCSNCGATGPYFAIQPWHDAKIVAQGKARNAWNARFEHD